MALRKPRPYGRGLSRTACPPHPLPPIHSCPGGAFTTSLAGPATSRGSPNTSARPSTVARPPRPALPRSPDPDLALNALERFFAHPAAAALLPDLLAADARKLGDVVRLFGTSQFLGDVLAADPDFLETATAPLRVTPTLAELVEALRADAAAGDDAACSGRSAVSAAGNCCESASTTSSATGPLEEVTADLSRVAEACDHRGLGAGVEDASRSGSANHGLRTGSPRGPRSWRSASSAAAS